MVLDVPILKHIRVVEFENQVDPSSRSALFAL